MSDGPEPPRPWQPTEQARLARILATGTRACVTVLLLAFVSYVAGIVPPRIPIADLHHYWTMDAATYRRLAKLPGGWGWLGFIMYGDFLNVAGLATLAGLMIAGYAVILATFVARRDRPYVLITVAQLVVLLLAASGLVAGHR